MKVAEDILVVIWILGPCVTRRPVLLWSRVDGVVMRSLGLFFPVIDVFVVSGFLFFDFWSDPGSFDDFFVSLCFYDKTFVSSLMIM